MSTHDCPGGCGRQVPRHHLACPTDWYRLPAELRGRISALYQRDPLAHAGAIGEAFRWYREHAS